MKHGKSHGTFGKNYFVQKECVFVVQKIPVILSLGCQLNNKEKKTKKFLKIKNKNKVSSRAGEF